MTATSANHTRVAALRSEMASRDINAYIIPSEDSHQSEYIAECDARRAFISGFTGSAGLAVVTTDKAALWTDGRYFLQASRQLGEGWVLQRSGVSGVPTLEEWLNKVLPKKSKVGIDPSLITVAAARRLISSLAQEGHSLASVEKNLVDVVWKDQPARPIKPVSVLPLKYTGRSIDEKIQAIRDQINRKGTWGLVVAALDEIAWLFNLRGSDIAYNPVFFAYAVVTLTDVFLYIDEAKLSDEVRSHLEPSITVRPYGAIFKELSAISTKQQSEEIPKKVWIDSRCSLALQNAIGGENGAVESRSPIMTAKSIKNEAEIEGFRKCHIRDAAALCRYFAWLEHELVEKKNTTISEVDGAGVLERFRSELSDFVGLSFDTISSSGANGSIIHYK
ncbi:Creatinase/Prolidase N-terminal domain-containing protein, partial [Blyttiomyces helicus]